MPTCSAFFQSKYNPPPPPIPRSQIPDSDRAGYIIFICVSGSRPSVQLTVFLSMEKTRKEKEKHCYYISFRYMEIHSEPEWLPWSLMWYRVRLCCSFVSLKLKRGTSIYPHRPRFCDSKNDILLKRHRTVLVQVPSFLCREPVGKTLIVIKIAIKKTKNSLRRQPAATKYRIFVTQLTLNASLRKFSRAFILFGLIKETLVFLYSRFYWKLQVY